MLFLLLASRGIPEKRILKTLIHLASEVHLVYSLVAGLGSVTEAPFYELVHTVDQCLSCRLLFLLSLEIDTSRFSF